MFNPHIHQQQQQQQQQIHQHLRQLQQLFHQQQQQQPPPPPPPPQQPQPPPGHHVAHHHHHHHQTPRPMPVPAQTAPPPRMVRMCQTTQTTILAPNPMLQGAILMQQMQGNMRGFGMGGQQFRQFFPGNRSSLLGPVPMGMAIKTPMMGFPGARPFHPHARFYNNSAITATPTTAASSSATTTTTDSVVRQSDRKRDSDQIASGSSDDQPAGSSTGQANDKNEADGAVGGVDGAIQASDEQLEEPVVKRQRTEESDQSKEQCGVEIETIAGTAGDAPPSECNSRSDDILEEGCSTGGSDVMEVPEESNAAEEHGCLSVPSPSGRLSEDGQQVGVAPEEMVPGKDPSLVSPENQEAEEGEAGGANKFYCYLCSITCHSQQNFRSHMNSISHQQRMMEIQHMSNACLVTLLPRVQESLQGAIKDGEKKAEPQRWCATCQTHFTSSIKDHRRTEEHKLASRAAVSSCTVCKKHFRTSQIFVEHLQSAEHRQRVEKLQETEGSDVLPKLDTDGFSLEEAEVSDVEEGEDGQMTDGDEDSSDRQDGWTSVREVTLKDMASDEQYDPDTVYGSSFFVPVAGFICRLCNKFYHFESSSLHTHCKSLKHFENLKRHRTLLKQKSEASESLGGPPLAEDDLLRPETEAVAEENHLSGETAMDTNSWQPPVSPTGVKPGDEQPEGSEPDPTSGVTTTSTTEPELSHRPEGEREEEEEGEGEVEEEATSQAGVCLQENTAEVPAGSVEEPDADPAPAPAPAPAAEEPKEEEEEEAPAVAGRKRAKIAPKRRSGRAASRR